jgi:hypothetical protein
MGDTFGMGAFILLIPFALIVICGVALIGFFAFMVRASMEKRPAGMFRWVARAGLVMVALLAAFHPLWDVWKRFNTNFGNSVNDGVAVSPIVLLYLVWTSILLVCLAARAGSKPLTGDSEQPR